LKLADYWGERVWFPLPAYSSAVLTALLFGSLAAQDPLNGALIYGLLLGVTVAQKVDRGNLVVGIVATVIFTVLFQAPFPSLWLMVIVAIAAALDEVGHDRSSAIQGKHATVFRFRPALKLVVFSLGWISWIPYQMIVNILGFDLAYEGVNWVLTRND
jgi:hypothetical protein